MPRSSRSFISLPSPCDHSPARSIASANDDEHESHELDEQFNRLGAPPKVHTYAESQASLLSTRPSNKPPRLRKRSTRGSWKENTKRLRREGFFGCLTALAGVMVVINFLQAALLDRLHSFVWITGFPLVDFIFALLGIAVFVWRSWGRLKAEWHAAEAPEHIAWFGIILAIVSTTIICESIYMPLVAVPAWHQIQWTSTMSISNTTGFPAIVVVGAGENDAAQFMGVECDIQGIHGGWDCTTSGVQTYDDGEYVTVNTTDQPNELINNSVDGSNAVLHLTIYTTYNSSASPGLYIGFFDPSINFNMTDFLYVCGNPPVYHCILPLVSTSTYLSFHAETYRLEDDIGALKEERATSDASADQTCSSQVLGLTSYTYYDGTYDTPSMGEGITNGTCDVAYGNGDVKNYEQARY